MKVRRLLCILLSSCLLTSCIESDVLEHLSLMIAVGYDAVDPETIRVTANFFESQPDAKEHNRTATVESSTTKGAQYKLNEQLPFKVATGQVRSILLDKKMVEYKKLNEIDVLSRDPTYGDVINIALVDGTAEEILNHPYKNVPNVGIFLNSLFEHNIKYSWCQNSTLHEFTRCRDQHTSELVMPIIKLDNDEIKITSLALFHGDQIVGEAVPKEAYFIKALTTGAKKFQYETLISRKEVNESPLKPYFKHGLTKPNVKVVFEIIRNHATIKLVNPETKEFNVNVTLDIDIQEISERYLFNEPGAKEALKKQLNAELTKDLQTLLDRLRKINSDCIGAGEIYRSRVYHSNAVGSKWDEEFPNTKLNADVKIKIVRTGTIE